MRLLSIAGCFLLLALGSAVVHAAPPRGALALFPYEKAQRMREALEGRPEHQRTRREYERVIEAYRVVYHGDPASARADASIAAVADLLAEEGRVFQDDKSLRDAVGQYEFLRKEYPGSRYRFSALLTIGEIYLRDLNDRESARATFQQFLKLYPQSPLANEARLELSNLRHPKRNAPQRFASTIDSANPPTEPSVAKSDADSTPATARRRNNVLTAAVQSQAAQSTSGTTASGPAKNTERANTPIGLQESDLPPPSATPAKAADAVPSRLSDAALNAPPPPRRGKLPLVTGIRHWSTPVYTRVAIDLQDEVQYEAVRVPNPDRIFFDLHGARLSPELIGKSVEVIDDGFLKQIRTAQFSNDVTRIVLDVSDVSEYSAFFLPNPSRLIIDVHGRKSHAAPVEVAAAPKVESPKAETPQPAAAKKEDRTSRTTVPAKPTIGIGPELAAVDNLGTPLAAQPEITPARKHVVNLAPPDHSADHSARTDPSFGVVGDRAAGDHATPQAAPTALADVATLGSQPNRVKATRHPTTAPVAQSVAGTTPAPQPEDLVAANTPPPAAPKTRSKRNTASNDAPPVDLSASEVHPAQPTADGQRSLVRTLGLKINRIVVDAGHGGHDSGTLGPGGIEEKDVVLDVALRLGALLKQKLGADVIYTRDDDTFIPLETRTAIANKAQADLFISIHANSSPDASARGVETYYLNFTTSADALEVAARENAVSDQSIHQLSDLVKKIALQDKINESREFASDVEQSLYGGLEDGNPGLKDRGIKKAPFVVLIGANMPSILAEISFLTNPDDAHELRDSKYRERIADSIYRGVARYVGSLSGVRIADASHGTN
ncbi:N-acetylmuramoyl-L-alanine amidase [Silvibacterium bohemicum]|nr:N-acetylmuramoyl-L-alanine amidase [Silvibacterium bohemicum]